MPAVRFSLAPPGWRASMQLPAAPPQLQYIARPPSTHPSINLHALPPISSHQLKALQDVPGSCEAPSCAAPCARMLMSTYIATLLLLIACTVGEIEMPCILPCSNGGRNLPRPGPRRFLPTTPHSKCVDGAPAHAHTHPCILLLNPRAGKDGCRVLPTKCTVPPHPTPRCRLPRSGRGT